MTTGTRQAGLSPEMGLEGERKARSHGGAVRDYSNGSTPGDPMRAAWWWIDRWRKSTAYTDMTAEEQGVYRNLLDECWLRDGIIPDSDFALKKISGDPDAWPRVREKVLARFTKVDGGYRNETADEVIAKGRTIHKVRSEAGKAGAAKREANRQAKGEAKRDTKHQPPSPDPSKEPTTTEGNPSGSLALKGKNSPGVRIFEYWRSKVERPRSQYTPKKRAMLRSRWRELKGDDGEREALLKLAVDGAVGDSFFSGAETGKAYLEFENLFRNSERVEKLIGLAEEQRSGKSRKKTLTDKNRETIAGYKRPGE